MHVWAWPRIPMYLLSTIPFSSLFFVFFSPLFHLFSPLVPPKKERMHGHHPKCPATFTSYPDFSTAYEPEKMAGHRGRMHGQPGRVW
jgi:hypothetical protein